LHQSLLHDVFLAVSDWVRAEPGRGRAWLPLDVRIDDRNVFARPAVVRRDPRTAPPEWPPLADPGSRDRGALPVDVALRRRREAARL
jgi:hypothetical protein